MPEDGRGRRGGLRRLTGVRRGLYCGGARKRARAAELERADPMNPFRALFRLESLVTLVAGVQAVATPVAFATGFDLVLPPELAVLVRWLGATYLVIAAAEWLALDLGGATTWRVLLLALLVGDVAHVATHVPFVLERGELGLADAVAFGLMAVLVPARLLVLADPARVRGDDTVATETAIAAPAEVAWRVLTQLDAYPAWSPFVPRVDGRLAVGERVVLHVRLRPDRPAIHFQPGTIEVLDEGRELRWGMGWGRGLLLRASRRQLLRPAPGGCVYVSTETFRGLLAPLVLATQRGTVRRGFVATGEALGRRAEALHADGAASLPDGVPPHGQERACGPS